MEIDVVKAITTFMEANDSDVFYTGIAGRYYHKQAPQGVTSPYMVFSIYDGKPDYFLAVETMESFNCQFDIYHVDDVSSTVAGLQKKLKTLFDDATITVSGYKSLLCERVMSILHEPELTDQVKTQRATVEYLLTFYKQ